ncbi:hypothetical protein CAOG_08332 [Capsaspora owczarzaki ATCC 30864]|uniref:Uncharacterized protein n=1 Tax=Capsaspora owczarzaki (strain ATCC 30864) TaxID=595528 RepID=A0A0D2W243_CAPO3|nr:hypothetical protein CAOG_08332 [Capsaspora owczarzaki ATCC 30864]KJE98437.1 hypothetical protein CAOG_008332 [Capsaspora owczarzaki ATCC 30864]|eukprot:XP_004340367.1 hypothetical protein CAOG_08332 [Capsaspora owczarzaki ATCC 30864]
METPVATNPPTTPVQEITVNAPFDFEIDKTKFTHCRISPVQALELPVYEYVKGVLIDKFARQVKFATNDPVLVGQLVSLYETLATQLKQYYPDRELEKPFKMINEGTLVMFIKLDKDSAFINANTRRPVQPRIGFPLVGRSVVRIDKINVGAKLRVNVVLASMEVN